MKVKEVVERIGEEVKKGLEAIGKEDIRERVKPRLVRHFVGVYFDREVKERISKRFKGEIPESSSWSLKKEVLSYGQKLVGLTGIPQIEQAHFDRIVDCAIISHNKKAAELRQAEEKALRAALKKDQPSSDDKRTLKEVVEQVSGGPVTLGMSMGVSQQ
jgi:hypothetical protein